MCALGANTGQTRQHMAAILKFKMAAEDTLEKDGSNSAFVHWSKKVKSIGSTSTCIANFALDYITPCTINFNFLKYFDDSQYDSCA